MDRIRFPDQYYDSETGLHYNGARYFDPLTGRYITSDPVGLDGGMNTYLYANANPLYWIDPDGRNAFGASTANWGGPRSGDGSASIGAGATIGSTTVGYNSKKTGAQWGQTTQLGLGFGLEFCFNEKPKSDSECSASDDSENDSFPDNYTAGTGRHMGIRINKDGSFCINIGPSVGLPAGAGWDL